jgi:hypothetical protein
MTDHKTGTRQEWLAARLELLEAEKALTRRGDELARQRQELPWVRIGKARRTSAESTASGACTSGSTARHSAATRPASGGAATTSTAASDGKPWTRKGRE